MMPTQSLLRKPPGMELRLRGCVEQTGRRLVLVRVWMILMEPVTPLDAAGACMSIAASSADPKEIQESLN